MATLTTSHLAIPDLSPAAETYARVARLAALCQTPAGLRVLHPTEAMRIPVGTMSVMWCASTAARQIEIEVAKGSSVKDAAAKYGIELTEHGRLLFRAKIASLVPRTRR